MELSPCNGPSLHVQAIQASAGVTTMGNRRTGGGITLIIAGAMALFALFRYFGSNQINAVTGQKQHVSISPNQEIALGLQAAPEMEQQFGGLSVDPHGYQLVESVGNKIVSESAAHKSPY